MTRACALALLVLIAGCGPTEDLRELGSDPLASLELEGASVDRRSESDAGGSLMGKPTRAGILTVYAIAPDADPKAVRRAALDAAREAGWQLEENSAEVAGAPIVRRIRTCPSGKAALAIYFNVDYSSGEPILQENELIISLQHEWQG